MSVASSSRLSAARNQGIDALRGVSILLVVMHHLGIRLPLGKTVLAGFLPAWLLDGVNWNGSEAVVIFFVISGFLITHRSQQRWGGLDRLPARTFYRMRASRIVPCLLLLIGLLSLFHLLGVPYFVIDKAGQSLGGAIASALGLYLNWYEGMTGYLPGGWDVLWSLSVEEMFYLAFPVVCLTLVRARLLVPALIVLALSLPFTRAALAGQHNAIWMEKAYLPGMSAIALGVLSALLVVRFPSPKRYVAVMCALGGLCGVCAVLFAGKWVWAALHHGYGLLLAGSAACLVVGMYWIQTLSPERRLRGLGWLQSCGRLSYEIYLFHMFCVFAVVAMANHSGLATAWSFVWYVPAIALCWLSGLAVGRAFSQPCERWLRQRSTATPPARLATQSTSPISLVELERIPTDRSLE